MPCYRPLVAHHNQATGGIFFTELKRQGETRQILLPCGQCIGCKLQRANDWATRCTHEAQLHTENIFGTFTYAKEKLQTQSLCHRDWQLFMKKLRNALSRKWSANVIEISESLYQHNAAPSRSATANDLPAEDVSCTGFHPVPRVKYYMAGEYGSKTRRPHFHACIFGINFNDRKHYRKTDSGNNIYISETLDRMWGHGYTTIGDITYESAAYIARYIMQKKTGRNVGKYYEHIDHETGEITDLEPEYNKMSLKTAIGKEWLDKYKTDVYPRGNVITRGKINKAPKYYDKIFKKEEPENYAEMKTQREHQAAQYMPDNTEQRLKAKETVKRAQLNQLLRTI